MSLLIKRNSFKITSLAEETQIQTKLNTKWFVIGFLMLLNESDEGKKIQRMDCMLPHTVGKASNTHDAQILC